MNIVYVIISSFLLAANTYAVDLDVYQAFECDISTPNGKEVVRGQFDYDWDADSDPADYRVGEVSTTLQDGRQVEIDIRANGQPVFFMGAKIGSHYNEIEISANQVKAINMTEFPSAAIACRFFSFID